MPEFRPSEVDVLGAGCYGMKAAVVGCTCLVHRWRAATSGKVGASWDLPLYLGGTVAD